MIEIVIHGRGGQGAVTTGQLMAVAASYDDKESQTFPMFGVERCGAPVEAFVRLSDKRIDLRSQIYTPDIVIVLEPSLLSAVDVTKGLKKKGLVIINSNKKASSFGIKNGFVVKTVDATSVALEIFKKPIVNTAMLGAFSAVTELVSLPSLEKAVDDIFIGRKGKKIADLNKKAVREVYHKAKK
ncbi:pyruvate ferredoxin oxidoreductase [Candidatus Woesearchaeota archaeon]|nr:pyruvate ferredoxin oxidoreductase [Candidatus Woesearchaeota archaeon]|tara:strand:- start:36 stop:587 length:552 start_codon:yes stop_codon:yes gene_type:complete